MSKKKIAITGVIIAFFIILIDQLTKSAMIEKYITLIPNFLGIQYLENAGEAFGIGTDNIIVIVIANFVVLSIIIKFIRENQSRIDPKILIALFMILAGEISNLADRLIRGYVIDFIHIELFELHSFNVADIFVILGIALFCVITFKVWLDDFLKQRKQKVKNIEK